MANQIKFFALGGLGEHGKNMYIVEVNDRIFILDSGIKHPGLDLLGVDAVLPDMEYLLENKDKVKALFLSHGHIENIGAVPEILKEMNIGVYGTRFTISILEKELTELGMNIKDYRLYRINEDKELMFGNVKVSFYATSHSIPESLGIVITTPDGAIVYAPDFTFSANSDKKYKTGFHRLGEISKEKVLLLLPESLGSGNIGRTVSDNVLLHTVTEQLKTKGRTIFAMYSNDLDRMQKIINIASSSNKRIAIIGKRTRKIISVAMESNYLNIPSDKFVNLKYIDDSNDNDYEDLVVIVTGELNEPFIHVQRMASGKDRFIKIKDTDTIVLISPHVKGYPNTFANTMNALARTNAKVINMTKKDLRSSHASPEDLKMLYMMLKPEYIAPVIGEYRHQYAHMQVALDAGYSREEILLLENGEVITFLDGKLQVAKEFVPTGDVLVDGLIVGDINSVVLKDREMLAQGGVVIINVIVDARYKEVLAEPSIVLRGVTNNKQVEADIYDIINEVVDDTLDYHFDEKYLDWQVIKKEIKDVVSKRIMKECGLNPIVLAVVLDEEK